MEIIAIIFLITSYLSGYLLTVRFFPSFKNLLRVASAYVLGILVSVWLVFLLSLIFYHLTDHAMVMGFILTTTILLAFVVHERALFKSHIDLRLSHVIFFSVALFYSWVLFSSTFDYDGKLDEIKISRLIYSDYGFHIPLIRSFSLGNNLSLEHPLYAHESIRYHFLFDFMVGVLEKMGIPLDYALTLPSALLWTSLLVLIYYLAKGLFFGSRFVGFVSIALFLLNSSLAFVEFIKKYPHDSLSSVINSWWRLRDYVAFGPWDGNIIVAFRNWNDYINQRQLILGCALVVLVLNHYIHEHFNKEKDEKITYGQKAFVGLITGLVILWHGHAFICLFGFLCLFFLLFPERKKSLVAIVVAFIIALPQMLWLQQSSPNVESHFSLNPGYLLVNHLIPIDFMPYRFLNLGMSFIISFTRYWFFNIGLSLITIPVSFFLVDGQRKKVFLIFMSLFIVGNLFQFSPEMAANHKFFSLWILLGNMFTAYLLYRLFQLGWGGRVSTVVLLFFLTVSGLVDMPPIKNDYSVTLSDFEKQPLAKWALENTGTNAVFLTTYRIYNPISFTGRRTMQGWPYFAWGTGYNTLKREKIGKKIYETNSKVELCSLLRENRIDYVQTEKVLEENPVFKINHEFFNTNFKPIFFDPKSNLKERVFATKDMCPLD